MQETKDTSTQDVHVSIKSNKRYFLRRKINPYIFISPFFILYAVFGLYPLIMGMVHATHLREDFVGFDNFRNVIQDQRFWTSIQNAFMYTMGSVFIILPIALIVALMLFKDRVDRFRGFLSTVIFTPVITSVIVAGIVFRFILGTHGGVLNTALMGLRITDSPIRFLADPRWAIPSLVIMGSWRFFGLNSIYFLAGLQGIPKELREAARIDGATPFQEFARITLPLLKPIMTFIVFFAITGSFGLFGEVFTLIGPGNTGARDSMLFPVLYLYIRMFRDGRMNEAAVIGFVVAVILLAITCIQRYLMREKE